MPLWYGGSDIADQSGRYIIITGGTSGLGLSTAKALTSRGAQVIVTGRSPAKGDRYSNTKQTTIHMLATTEQVPPHRAVADVRAYTKNGHIEFIKCDVSDLRLVILFASAPL